MALLLVVQGLARSRRKTGFFFPGHAQKLNFRGACMAPKKEARPKGPGTPYALRRNIFRKRQKTMGCFAFG
jgi:hypothetical protein